MRGRVLLKIGRSMCCSLSAMVLQKSIFEIAGIIIILFNGKDKKRLNTKEAGHLADKLKIHIFLLMFATIFVNFFSTILPKNTSIETSFPCTICRQKLSFGI